MFLNILLLFTIILFAPLRAKEAVGAIEPEIIPEEEFTQNSTTTPEKKAPLRTKKKSNDNSEEEKADIFLNFENSSLANVVNYMAELKDINLLPDKSLADVKVSLTIREPLTKDGAWKIFLTLLEVSGFSIINVDGLYRVMPKDKKKTEPLPSYINVPYTSLPDSDLTIRYVTFLQNLQVDAVKDLLDSLLSDNHTLFPHAQANCFIITDRCYNIKSAMKVIHELDATGQAETVVVMKLKRTNATDVKALLEGLMKKTETNPLARLFAKSTDTSTEYFPAGTKIVAEERTNALILMGNPDPIKKIEKFITEYIDVELKAAESPLHIYELQYTDATQIAEILREVTAPPEQGPGQQAAKYGAIRGGVKYFKSMKFIADKEANRLIVSCTDKQDWKMLKEIIKDLDKPQPQVAMETMFVEITASDLDHMGGSLRIPKINTLGGSIQFQSANNAAASLKEPEDSSKDPISLLGDMLRQLIPAQGSTLLSFGKRTNIWSVFEMIRTRSNASVLSQPFITIANKVTGKIAVGEERNVLMEEGASGGGKGYGPVSADTSLEIEPQINLDGVIRLKINVNISEFSNASLGEKSSKQVNTNVTMADGQVLVLGGFVKTKVGETTTKTPLLSNIPILGWFFKKQERTVDRRYIFIFMAPTIIKPRTTPGVELYTKMKLHSATNDIEDGIKTVKTNDPLHNWFFDPKRENYSHKVVDFANARYQPTSVDIKHDSYYRSSTDKDDKLFTPSNSESVYDSKQEDATVSGKSNVINTTDVVTASEEKSEITSQFNNVIPEQKIIATEKVQASADVPALVAMARNKSIATHNQEPENNTALTQEKASLETMAGLALTKKESLPSNPAKNLAKSLIEKRLGLNQQTEVNAPNDKSPIAARATDINAKNPFPVQPIEVQTQETAAPQVEAHEAQEEVFNVLNSRLQKKRLISVDDEQLTNKRKKLKALISKTYKDNNESQSSNQASHSEKKDALKNLLAVPSLQHQKTQSLTIDPVKRNSLKNFLSQADQSTATRKNAS